MKFAYSLLVVLVFSQVAVRESEGFIELAGCVKDLAVRSMQCARKCVTVYECPIKAKPTSELAVSTEKPNAFKRFFKRMARQFRRCRCKKCAFCAVKCVFTVGLGDPNCNLATVINDIAKLFGAKPPISQSKQELAMSLLDTFIKTEKEDEE